MVHCVPPPQQKRNCGTLLLLPARAKNPSYATEHRFIVYCFMIIHDYSSVLEKTQQSHCCREFFTVYDPIMLVPFYSGLLHLNAFCSPAVMLRSIAGLFVFNILTSA